MVIAKEHGYLNVYFVKDDNVKSEIIPGDINYVTHYILLQSWIALIWAAILSKLKYYLHFEVEAGNFSQISDLFAPKFASKRSKTQVNFSN